MSSKTAPNVSPNRDDVRPDTYAVYVDDDDIHVFQYRVTISDREGAWYFVETLNHENDPRLSLDLATPMSPSKGGYWIYSKTYDCQLDCD